MKQAYYNEIACIIDASGSMNEIADDSIGGFNAFLKEQQELPIEINLSLILFNHDYKIIYENVPIKDVKPIDRSVYKPHGNTALLDAIGKTIDAIGLRLNNTTEENRPEKVIICILTDGQENCSKEFELDKIKEMITHQHDTYSWEFVFLAANQDAFDEGSKLGIDSSTTSNFKANKKGVRHAYKTINETVRGLYKKQ